MENSWQKKLSKNLIYWKIRHFYNMWLYLLCRMFHVNIRIMNNDRYVLVLQTINKENVSLSDCLLDDYTAILLWFHKCLISFFYFWKVGKVKLRPPRNLWVPKFLLRKQNKNVRRNQTIRETKVFPNRVQEILKTFLKRSTAHCNQAKKIFRENDYLNPLSANPTKWWRNSQNLF